MERTIYFEEPRLQMSVGGRFLVRLITYCVYAILVVGAATLLLSDLRELRAIGILLGLFLLDRAMGAKKARRSLVRLPAGRVNAAEYLAPQAYRIIERALDRVSLQGGDFVLECSRLLLDRREIQLAFMRMDIDADEVKKKLKRRLKRRAACVRTVRSLQQQWRHLYRRRWVARAPLSRRL